MDQTDVATDSALAIGGRILVDLVWNATGSGVSAEEAWTAVHQACRAAGASDADEWWTERTISKGLAAAVAARALAGSNTEPTNRNVAERMKQEVGGPGGQRNLSAVVAAAKARFKSEMAQRRHQIPAEPEHATHTAEPEAAQDPDQTRRAMLPISISAHEYVLKAQHDRLAAEKDAALADLRRAHQVEVEALRAQAASSEAHAVEFREVAKRAQEGVNQATQQYQTQVQILQSQLERGRRSSTRLHLALSGLSAIAAVAVAAAAFLILRQPPSAGPVVPASNATTHGETIPAPTAPAPPATAAPAPAATTPVGPAMPVVAPTSNTAPSTTNGTALVADPPASVPSPEPPSIPTTP